MTGVKVAKGRTIPRGDIQARHIAEKGRLIPVSVAYDSFTRVDSASLGRLDSTQKWTEDSGQFSIVSNNLAWVSGTALATFPFVRQESVEAWLRLQVADVTDVLAGLTFRHFGISDYLLLHFPSSSLLRISKMVAGVLTTVATASLSAALVNTDIMQLHLIAQGGVIIGTCHQNGAPALKTSHVVAVDPLLWTDFSRGTRMGLYTGNGNVDIFQEIMARAY